MNEKEPLNLGGNGFSKQPLSDQELAEFRSMFHHYVRHYKTPDEIAEALGIMPGVKVLRAIPAFSVIAAIGGGLAVLRAYGWL